MLAEILLTIAVILILVDLFIETEIPSLIGFGLIAFVAARAMSFPLLWQAIFGVAAFAALVSLHYLFLHIVLRKAINKLFTPDKIKTGARALIGKRGVVREIEGAVMLSAQGDLWNIDEEDKRRLQLSDGQEVHILSEEGGALRIDAYTSNKEEM